jgi:hypothetical protein
MRTTPKKLPAVVARGTTDGEEKDPRLQHAIVG